MGGGRTAARHGGPRGAAARGLALITLVALASARTEAAEPQDRARLVAAAREIMQKARYCALVTLGPGGQPQARVVDPLAPEPDLTVFVATRPTTRKVAEIRADPRVTLFYFDAASRAYVTLVATAEIVTDPAERAARFKDDWAPFYKDGPRGEDFLLIRVRPRRLEVASEGHGITNEPSSWRPTTLELP